MVWPPAFDHPIKMRKLKGTGNFQLLINHINMKNEGILSGVDSKALASKLAKILMKLYLHN